MKLSDYPHPAVTVDIVIFTVIENHLKVLLVKRNDEPFKDTWALPGGFVRMDEDIKDAAERELKEETGVTDVYLEQLYTFGDITRDPRGRVITVTYIALVNSENLTLHPSTDVKEANWFSIASLPKLAFDHKKILEYSYQRLKWKFEYTTVAFSLLPKKFTISQILNIYEIVFDKKFDKRNFVKKIKNLKILKPEETKKDVSFRPPKLYSLKKKIGDIIEII